MKKTFQQYAIYHDGKRTNFQVVATSAEAALEKAKAWVVGRKIEVVNIEDSKDRA